MGACFSAQKGRPEAPRISKGPSPYDSVWSVAQKQQEQQQKHHKKHHTKARSASKPAQQAQQQEHQQQQKKPRAKRMPQIDMATGELIPDFGVHGIFDVLYELGSGGSGQTYLCRDMESGKVVAVKFVPRPLTKAAIPFMMAEVEIQAELGEGSLNLISMHEIILTRSHLALVLEYASGGSLTEKVASLWESALQRGGLFMEEQEASYHLRQFVHSINYCHKHRVAHRDLKLDNTLLEECIVGPPRVKICDFGFAKRWSGNKDTMHDAIGTPVYMSPQMLAARQCASGYSGIKADMWAVGILLFVMLLGSFPFDHDAHDDPNSSEAANEVWLKQQQQGWRKNPRAAEVLKAGVLSEACCDLLDKLLMVDEDKRVTSDEILHHPWLHIPLSQEQQDAWERLQREQAEVDKQLREEGNPRLAKLRKEAMFAMMAIATKAPSRTLFPTATAASGSLHTAASLEHSIKGSDTAAAAPVPVAVHTDHAGMAVSAVSPAAATAAVGEDDLVFNQDAVHMSFMTGEGVRTNTLEEKVEVYRQQQSMYKQARTAAAMAAVRENGNGHAIDQKQQDAGGLLQQEDSTGSSRSSTNDAAAAAAAEASSGPMDNAAPAKTVKHLFSRKDSAASSSKPSKSPFAAAASSAAASDGSSKHKGSTSSSKVAQAPAGPTDSSTSADDSSESDTPDEVWRLPLTSTVDPSVFKLTPELSVAAGALIRQLQKTGEKLAGRGRSSRSSCPMY